MDDAYQVFDNGELAGHFGDFTGSTPVAYYTQPKMFPLAATDAESTEPDRRQSTRVLAFRLWMEPHTLINQPDAGGMHTAPVLGEAGAVAAGYQMRWLELIRSYASFAARALLFGLLAVVAFTLILFDRSDRVYLWMGALFLLPRRPSLSYRLSGRNFMSIPINNLLLMACLLPLIYAAWVMVLWVWFGQQRPAWLPRLAAGLTLLLMVSAHSWRRDLSSGLSRMRSPSISSPSPWSFRLLFFALLLWVVVEGIRRQGVEGWLVLPVVVLRGIMPCLPSSAFSISGSIGSHSASDRPWRHSRVCSVAASSPCCCCGGCSIGEARSG